MKQREVLLLEKRRLPAHIFQLLLLLVEVVVELGIAHVLCLPTHKLLDRPSIIADGAMLLAWLECTLSPSLSVC